MADKHKILIVEDDKYIINFISMSLKKEDYDYVIAEDMWRSKCTVLCKQTRYDHSGSWTSGW